MHSLYFNELSKTLGIHQMIKIQYNLPKENHHIYFQNEHSTNVHKD